MASDGDETAVDLSAADCFRDGGGADAGHVAIDDAGEFVEGDDRRPLTLFSSQAEG